MNSSKIFSIAFAILFPVLIYLTTEVFVLKHDLKNNMEKLQISFEDKLNEINLSFKAQLANASNTFDMKIDEVNQSSIDTKQMYDNVTASFATKFNETLEQIDNSFNEGSKEVQNQLLNLTQDIGSYVNTTTDQFNSQGSLMAIQFAGTFTILGILIFIYHLGVHLRTYIEPTVQRKIIAMLWMAPIYSMTSFCSLVFVSSEGFLAIFKDFYEGYCIFMFLSFLIAVLGRGDRGAVVELLAKQGDRLELPFYCCGLFGKSHYENPYEKADAILRQCQIATLQFVFLRPLTSICMAAANSITAGEDISIWNAKYPQFYIYLVVNVSVFVAFSGLLKFYHAVHDELLWCQPFPKFLCIKGVVFMTFWQGVVISLIAKSSFDDDLDGKNWSLRAQNFIICVEMFFFSVAHIYVFPPEEWEEGYRPAETVRRKFGDNIALRDFVQDVRTVLRSSSRKKVSETEGEMESETESKLSNTEEKVNAITQMEDEDDFTFVNRIIKEAETLKLEEEAERPLLIV